MIVSGVAKPAVPVVGQLTHHTVELSWETSLDKANEQHDKELSGDARIKVQLEQKDRTGSWTNMYTYVANSCCLRLAVLIILYPRLRLANDASYTTVSTKY